GSCALPTFPSTSSIGVLQGCARLRPPGRAGANGTPCNLQNLSTMLLVHSVNDVSGCSGSRAGRAKDSRDHFIQNGCSGTIEEPLVMKQIMGLEKIEQALGPLRLIEFPLVREIRYFAETSDDGLLYQNIDLTLESKTRDPNYRLTFRFHRVQSVKVDGIGGG